MPLVKQRYTLSLAQGVDTKTDPKQVAGKALLLENAVFVSPLRLKKRPGYAPFEQRVLANGSTTTPTGNTIASTLDLNWPRSIQTFQSTQTTLTVTAPSPSAPGGPRLVYATILWKTYRNPATGLYTDATGGTGSAVEMTDTNGTTWVQIAQADFPSPGFTAGHHGAEIWAAWYSGQVPQGTVFTCTFPHALGQTLNTLFTVYSRYNTASGVSAVTDCFGSTATSYNLGGGTEAIPEPIYVPMAVTLSMSATTSAAVVVVQDGIDAGGVPGTPTSTTTVDAENDTNTRQVSGTVEGGYTGGISVGLTGTGAWNNIAAAEIIGGPEYVVTPGSDNPPIAEGNALLTLGSQLLLHDGTSLYSWGAADNAWFPVRGSGMTGGFPALTVTQKSLIKNSGFQAHPDGTVHPAGYTCIAYEDTIEGGVRYSIFDTATGSPVFFDQEIPTINGISTTSTYAPKVLSFGKWILILYTSTDVDASGGGGTNLCLYCTSFDTTDPFRGFYQTQIITSDFSTDSTKHLYDACLVGSTLVIACAPAAFTPITLKHIAPTGLGDMPWSFQTGSISSIATAALTVFPDSTPGQVVTAWCDGTSIRFAVHNATTMDAVKSATSVSAEAPCHITGTAVSGVATDIHLFWTIPALPVTTALPSNYKIRHAHIGSSYTVGTSSDLLRSVGLCGKAFVYDEIAYVPIAFETGLQPTNFIADESGNIVAKMLPGVGIGQLWGYTNGRDNTLLPESTVVGNSVYMMMQERFALSTSSLTTSAGVTNVCLNFGTKIQSAVLANILHFGGGLLFMYDGASAVEHGFHVYPENISAPNPGGDYKYSYTVCYEWMDLQGNLHRSAPAIAIEHAQTAPIDGTNSVRVTIPTLRLTAKQLSSSLRSRKPVTCTVYRTENLGTTFHRVNQTIEDTANDTSIDSIVFTDSTTDDELRDNEQLYTTGNVLENISPPCPSYLTVIENRVWMIDATNPLRLWYSKEAAPGTATEFSDYLTWNLEPRGERVGGATAIVRLDDKKIVFREHGLGYITGAGPDALGGQNDFREYQLPAEVGCTEPASANCTGEGLFFKSAKGFYALSRSLETSYIGAAVEEWNDQRVTSAVLLPRTHWALITIANGTALMWDYLYDQWSVFTDMYAVDGTVYQDLHVYLDAAGVVHQETPGIYSHNGAYIPMRLKTAWVQLAGLQGFKRIWQFLLLGDWFSSHKLKVDLSYDFDGSIVSQTNTVTFDTEVVPLQFRVQCAVEQCQAMQIAITELQPDDGSVGEGLSLAAICFEVGLKPGSFRLPASKTVG